MSKWLTGCVVVFVLLGIAMWYGFRKMSQVAAGPPPAVAIRAPASRVFASLANADSMTTWMSGGRNVRVSHHGPLTPGDTITVQSRRALGGRFDRVKWIVSEIVPDRLLVLRVVDDSTGAVMGVRRDSLVSVGDSTVIVSNITIADLSTLARKSGDTPYKSDEAVLKMGSRMMFSAFRIQAKLDFEKLKARIEGRK
jgi:uncharacterized protein YndB with AHSA1/START domain